MKTSSPKKSASKIAADKTEQKLNEISEINQKQFQNVLLHSPNIFIILEGFPEMIITFANEPLYKSWGKTAAIIGKPLMEVVPEIKDQTFPALLQQVFETGKTHYSSEERAVIHINGNPFDKYYNYVYQPIFNDNQKVTGVTVMATDITELVFNRKKVEDSEALFRLALFLTAKTVFKQDTQLKYTWIYNTHPSFEIKNLLGKTDREILNNDTAEILTTIKQTVLNTGSTFTGDIELEIDGKAGVFAMRVEATKDSAGIINGIIAVSDDITDQKQASQYARSLIEASLDPLVTISADGKITDVNEASIKVTGVEREKLIDTDFSNYFTEPQKAQEGYQQVFEKGFVADYPLTIKHKNGNLTDVLYNASVYKDDKGNVLGVFAAARDVTIRKMFEKEMIDAKVSAENATKSKQQFLSNMSHEIRTPLNSIIGFTNVLLKTELGLQQKEFVEAISTSGKSLNLLINDILDLAKVDAGKMTFEKRPIEIRKSITSIVHSFDMKIKEKNLELAVEHDSKVPSVLLGDSLRLNQIFFNLLSNAVKFTPKGKIKLTIKLLHEDTENVTIEFVVSDSGIGIPDNKLNSIFNLFEQAEINTSTSYGGTGLGLSIVKQLVEGQAGSVSVKSKLGEGLHLALRFLSVKQI